MEGEVHGTSCAVHPGLNSALPLSTCNDTAPQVLCKISGFWSDCMNKGSVCKTQSRPQLNRGFFLWDFWNILKVQKGISYHLQNKKNPRKIIVYCMRCYITLCQFAERVAKRELLQKVGNLLPFGLISMLNPRIACNGHVLPYFWENLDTYL